MKKQLFLIALFILTLSATPAFSQTIGQMKKDLVGRTLYNPNRIGDEPSSFRIDEVGEVARIVIKDQQINGTNALYHVDLYLQCKHGQLLVDANILYTNGKLNIVNCLNTFSIARTGFYDNCISFRYREYLGYDNTYHHNAYIQNTCDAPLYVRGLWYDESKKEYIEFFKYICAGQEEMFYFKDDIRILSIERLKY